MARLSGIITKLAKHNINEQIKKEIIGNGDLVDISVRMEKLLDHETLSLILDSSACGTSQKELNAIRKIDGDTLQRRIEKITSLDDYHADWNVALTSDNSLCAGWIIKENDGFACVCSAAVDKKTKVCDLSYEDRTMPLSYCLCCAGHCRRHLEKLLDLRLKTREVISSPINSYGKNPCSFIFDII